MLSYPHIDPVAFSFGPVKIHWYGLMYFVGFIGGWFLGCYRAKKESVPWNATQVTDLLTVVMLGVIIGGRLGYVIFYEPMRFLADPILIVKIWQSGGMSFHGGLLGVLTALWIYSKRQKRSYWETVDFIAPLVPIGLGAGRIGNFINGELWGRVTEVPWAMRFPGAGLALRHPSQLYQFFLEGVLLFFILWFFSSKKRPIGAVSGVFAVCYGLFRFMVEFVRQPDAHLGTVFLGMTMGQLLTLPLFATGVWLLWQAYGRKKNSA